MGIVPAAGLGGEVWSCPSSRGSSRASSPRTSATPRNLLASLDAERELPDAGAEPASASVADADGEPSPAGETEAAGKPDVAAEPPEEGEATADTELEAGDKPSDEKAVEPREEVATPAEPPVQVHEHWVYLAGTVDHRHGGAVNLSHAGMFDYGALEEVEPKPEQAGTTGSPAGAAEIEPEWPPEWPAETEESQQDWPHESSEWPESAWSSTVDLT